MKSAYANALVGMALLAIPFALLGRYFKHISSEYVVPIVYVSGLAALAPLGLVMARMDGVVLTKPSVGQTVGIAFGGILLGLGDYFVVKAFNTGGSTLFVATIIALMPAAAAILAAILGAELPHWKTWVGWVFAAIAVILIRGGASASAQ